MPLRGHDYPLEIQPRQLKNDVLLFLKFGVAPVSVVSLTLLHSHHRRGCK